MMGAIRAMQTPWWWTSDGLPPVGLRLAPHKQALYDRFVRLETSGEFASAIGRWDARRLSYLKLTRAGAEAAQIQEAFLEAEQAADFASKRLSEAVVAVRWP